MIGKQKKFCLRLRLTFRFGKLLSADPPADTRIFQAVAVDKHASTNQFSPMARRVIYYSANKVAVPQKGPEMF
jgi:hypothetical protein